MKRVATLALALLALTGCSALGIETKPCPPDMPPGICTKEGL